MNKCGKFLTFGWHLILFLDATLIEEEVENEVFKSKEADEELFEFFPYKGLQSFETLSMVYTNSLEEAWDNSLQMEELGRTVELPLMIKNRLSHLNFRLQQS